MPVESEDVCVYDHPRALESKIDCAIGWSHHLGNSRCCLSRWSARSHQGIASFEGFVGHVDLGSRSRMKRALEIVPSVTIVCHHHMMKGRWVEIGALV